MLVGTAGATLAGLTFVAITSADRVVQRQGSIRPLRNVLDPALLAFALALLLGAVLLMPVLTPTALALVLVGCGLYLGGYSLFVFRQLRFTELVKWYDRLDWFFVVIMPVLGSVLLLFSGWLCGRGEIETALTVTGVALLGLILMGIRNALDTVVNVLSFNARQLRQEETGQGADPARPESQPPA